MLVQQRAEASPLAAGDGRTRVVHHQPRDHLPLVRAGQIVRRLRDLGHELRKTKKSLILLSPVQKVPPELEKSISAMVYWELPTRSEIEQIARTRGVLRSSRAGWSE